MNQEQNDQTNGITSKPSQSLWRATTPETNYQSQLQDEEVDILVIGGGITGITTAFLLLQEGRQVALMEQNKVVEDVTGNTTAKVTSQHGFIYHELAIKYGTETAKIYAEANESALSKIASIVEEYKIDCDFDRTSSYAYTEDPKNVEMVEMETSITKEIGLPASFATKSPLSFDFKAAVKFDNQAQFHPRKYLLELSRFIDKNGLIFENTRGLDIKTGKKIEVSTNHGKITANTVVMATHFPFFDKGFFYARLIPRQAYAIAFTIKGNKVPPGMYYTEDGNHHSIRNQATDKGSVLIIGGGYHHSGQGGNTLNYYRDIVGYAKKRFDIDEAQYHWSTQDYRSIDRLPFIGKSPKTKNIYLATGFGSWGMTNGTLAAMIIRDQILGHKNSWHKIFRPSRYKLEDTNQVIRNNTQVMNEYFKGIAKERLVTDVASIPDNEGRVVRIGAKKTAVYKDKIGILHGVKAACTHMRCIVNWNNAEKTWDCPCHGSRFDTEGKVIHGPAVWELKKRKVS